jgi:SAM-dependent methyltransferase
MCAIVSTRPMVLYDKIGDDYDKSRHADPFICGRLYSYPEPLPYLRYLDIACGTGNYTTALRNMGLHVCGIDRSMRMLNIARQKDSSIIWLSGTAETLPFPDNSFAGAICILAVHHFLNMEHVFNETCRVISNGRFVIFTATSEQMRGYWLNEYFPVAMEKSIDQMPGKNELIEALERARFSSIRFEQYEIRKDLEDFFLYNGKNHPEMYLNPDVRRNISTFAAIAEPGEIEQGCSMLDADIRSGRIHNIIDSYRALGDGDYVFVIAQR